jgi:integrase
VFTPAQEQAFVTACGDWQRSIFLPLATYGMRVGELTHLLVENVDFADGTIQVCSKPEMFWRVKTARRRRLPLTAEMAALLKGLIGRRTAGFVFLNEQFASGAEAPDVPFASDAEFRRHLERVAAGVRAADPKATKRDQRRAVTRVCRRAGQVPVKRIQAEFCKLTEQIGCPAFTRTHDLRHLFATRAQERGANPLLVQEIVGHRTLDMTRRYTHLGMDVKRRAIKQTTAGRPGVPENPPVGPGRSPDGES